MTKIYLKKYEVKREKRPCDICEKEFLELSSIGIRTWDTSRRYRGSNRPIVGTYKVKCCPKCFKIVMDKIEQII